MVVSETSHRSSASSRVNSHLNRSVSSLELPSRLRDLKECTGHGKSAQVTNDEWHGRKGEGESKAVALSH